MEIGNSKLKMKNRIIKLLPLIIILISSLITLVYALTNEIVLVKWQIVGLVLTAIAFIAQIFNPKLGYIITGFVLIIGLFAFASFTPVINTTSFRAGSLKITIDSLSIIVLLIYILVHRKELPQWIKELQN